MINKYKLAIVVNLLLCYSDDNDIKTESKMENELQNAVKNIEGHKTEIKSEMDVIKTENQDVKSEIRSSTPNVGQMFPESVHRVMTQSQQIAIQVTTSFFMRELVTDCLTKNIGCC